MTLPGIHSTYIYDNLGDVVGTGRNYKLQCSQGVLKLAYNSDNWEYVNTVSGPDLVVKFCKPNDCSRGHVVVDTEEYHFYTHKPRGAGYKVIAYHGTNLRVATNYDTAAASIKIEGNRDNYLVQEAGLWWTQENKSTYVTLQSKTIGDLVSCSFVYAGEDVEFRDEFWPRGGSRFEMQ